MDIKFNLRPTFESVFLINGRLVEGGEILYGENEVAYITVLPLSALLLPYTVKMVGSRVKSNPELCKCYCLGTNFGEDRFNHPAANHLGAGGFKANKFHLKFLPRHNYVYSVPAAEPKEATDLVDKFFICVREGKTEDARRCLSHELSESIDDHSLIGFFDDFVDIVLGDEQSLYHLIDKNGQGVSYSFVIKNGVIDNIIEM